MAAIKAYTNIEQSKKLAEILPIESADMVYYGIHQGIDGSYHLSGMNTEDDIVSIFKDGCEKVFDITDCDIQSLLPCWSLAALLDILPNYQMQTQDDGTGILCSCNGKFNIVTADNPVDVCYGLILKLHELNLL